MNLSENNIKSTKLEEEDIPQNLDLLNKWTIPKVDTRLIYDYSRFDKLSTKQVVKTTEQSLALNSDEQTIQLLNKRDIDLYKSRYNWMHIGMVQIAFKPLTLKGLPETFLAALRDARNLNLDNLLWVRLNLLLLMDHFISIRKLICSYLFLIKISLMR